MSGDGDDQAKSDPTRGVTVVTSLPAETHAPAKPARRAPLPLGTVVAGSYRLEAVRGVGGMGVVYAAMHERLDKAIAVKVMMPEFSEREFHRARFLREAKVCSRLRHPNAVAVHDFGEHAGRLFLVMDLLSGPSLRRVLGTEARGLAPDRVVRLGIQLAEVLQAAHALAIVHRDLKPENVMLERDADGSERAVLVDFGLAFLGEDEPGTPELGRLTKAGAVAGTPHYVSPEQARGLSIGPPSDIYALGVMLFELITGDAPFDASSPAEVVSQHLYVPPPSLRERYPAKQVPEALDALVNTMLAKSASARPSAAEVASELRDLASGGRWLRGKLPRTRDSRMIEPPPLAATAPAPVQGVVGVAGTVTPPLVAALAAGGAQVRLVDTTSATVPPDIDVILAPALAASDIKRLAQAAAPRAVIGAADRADMPRVLELLRAGATDVVAWPLEPDEVVNKITRAIRSRQRTGERP